MLVGLGRRLAAYDRFTASARPGSRTGPIHADVDAPAATVYAVMTSFEGDGDPVAADSPVRLNDGVVIRECPTPVSLPLGITRVIRTREEIRLVPPNAIEFRHLAGPVRGMTEAIVVEPLGDARWRVTYAGVLPRSSPVLRVALRLLARPAIERIVRAHFADLAQRAGAMERPATVTRRSARGASPLADRPQPSDSTSLRSSAFVGSIRTRPSAVAMTGIARRPAAESIDFAPRSCVRSTQR